MNQTLDYRLVRSDRKSLSMRIERNGTIVVRAPYSVSESTIATFVDSHQDWALRKIAELQNFYLDLRDGAEIFLFGSKYLIRTGKSNIAEHEIFLPPANRSSAFIRLVKKFALEVLTVLTGKLAHLYSFSYHKVRISSARGRWGSCSYNKDISYSFRIAFLTPYLCEYIIIHELCHTRHFNHSKDFWKEVEHILPDYKERLKALKKCSGIMSML